MENEREKQVYLAKLSEQTERYDGIFRFLDLYSENDLFMFLKKSDLLLLRSKLFLHFHRFSL
jgi:14-3-3 protein epsilon